MVRKVDALATHAEVTLEVGIEVVARLEVHADRRLVRRLGDAAEVIVARDPRAESHVPRAHDSHRRRRRLESLEISRISGGGGERRCHQNGRKYLLHRQPLFSSCSSPDDPEPVPSENSVSTRTSQTTLTRRFNPYRGRDSQGEYFGICCIFRLLGNFTRERIRPLHFRHTFGRARRTCPQPPPAAGDIEAGACCPRGRHDNAPSSIWCWSGRSGAAGAQAPAAGMGPGCAPDRTHRPAAGRAWHRRHRAPRVRPVGQTRNACAGQGPPKPLRSGYFFAAALRFASSR